MNYQLLLNCNKVHRACCDGTMNKLVIMKMYFIDHENLRTSPTLQMGLLAPRLILKVGTA
jgi:hypothetical protein